MMGTIRPSCFIKTVFLDFSLPINSTELLFKLRFISLVQRNLQGASIFPTWTDGKNLTDWKALIDRKDLTNNKDWIDRKGGGMKGRIGYIGRNG